LGAAWTILNPLAMISIYTLIFSEVMKTRLPNVDNAFAYSIYLCAGILAWGLFAEIVGRGQNIFLEHANLLKKISFPRLSLPIIVVFSAVLNFSIIFVLFTLFLIISGNFPGWIFFGIIPVLLLQITLAIGLGMTLGVLNVFFRDVGQFFSIFLQFWFWFTPIVYSSSILPETVQSLMRANPMASIIGAYQQVLVSAQAPNWWALWYPAVWATLLCLLGLRLFRKHSGEMVDEL
jgi:lipopolysaccharide transport system permease protein